MNRARIPGVAILSFLLFMAGQLQAQTKAMTPEELTRRADVIAIGKVTATRSEWDENKSRIVTRATMAVGEYLKGNAGNELQITTLGGEVDGVGEWYSHVARFNKDEEVVVFAEKDKKGNFRVSGGRDGKIAIQKDKVSGVSGVADRMNLDDLKTRIKSAVGAQISR